MNSNILLLNTFFKSLKHNEYHQLTDCYSDGAVYFDPIFGLLERDKLIALWEMLSKNAKGLLIEYGEVVSVDQEYYTCEWSITYQYPPTGRKVYSAIKSYFLIKDGKIEEHSNAYSIHDWSKQAIGFSGWLFGWNRFFQQSIKNKAQKALLKFMQEY